ncbi:hypothetical protein, conserved [Eimeria acervulina]|uniref:Uncharacterized protein n=1 Tax=Eimeria acervulina TaxID=5801 RepID=U6GAP6_EIMAC|nr:hypothetical protein, conserved [Eimeria acervulina]CDI76413.1 hypothetical protein, conserved [Eimeria acervulina]
MASPVTYNAPSVGSEPFNSQMEEADRYFTRRRQQFEAAVAARKSEGGVRLRPLRSRNRAGPVLSFEACVIQIRPTNISCLQAEDEIANLTAHEVDELRAVIAAQARRIECLQVQLQRQHQQLQQQEAELQQQRANAIEASSVIEEQQKQLRELRAQAAAAAAAHDKQQNLLLQRAARTEQLEEQLGQSLARSKEVVALRQKDVEQLQQLRRQQNSLARHIRAEKSMENAAKEAVVAARHAAELRKVTTQRDALAVAIKKQFKLIEVLKQQKAHLEAARWLQFTEEEFLKVVDAEGALAQARAEQQHQQHPQQELE